MAEDLPSVHAQDSVLHGTLEFDEDLLSPIGFGKEEGLPIPRLPLQGQNDVVRLDMWGVRQIDALPPAVVVLPSINLIVGHFGENEFPIAVEVLRNSHGLLLFSVPRDVTFSSVAGGTSYVHCTIRRAVCQSEDFAKTIRILRIYKNPAERSFLLSAVVQRILCRRQMRHGIGSMSS